MKQLHIGIDPGVHTGFAVWNTAQKKLTDCYTTSIVEAFHQILMLPVDTIHIRIEDARLRKYFAQSEKDVQAKRMGAGSIKRDCQIWQEFCEYYGISHELVAPKSVRTKIDSKTFVKITGYRKATNQHARDAAMLIVR